ncbi:MAG: hypothetical protein P4M12_08830 [Gammaproteobacteria bacterium]|nr:hypothetical protein [Gammaproteobacteria bacterium]
MANSREENVIVSPNPQSLDNLKEGDISKSISYPQQLAESAIQFQPNLERSMIKISVPTPPIKNISIDDLKIGRPLETTTFHSVYRAIDKNTKQKLFFKENPPNSFLSELEAVNAEYYKFIAPDYVPDTSAIYEVKNGGVLIYKGVVSAEIPGFIPVSLDPLKDDDLDIKDLAERNLFIILDNLENEIRVLEKKSALIEMNNLRLDEEEKAIQANFKKVNQGCTTDPSEIDLIKKQFLSNSTNKNKQFIEGTDLAKEYYSFYKKLQIEHNVSKIQFEKYRIIKGAAIGLTASYIFMEDDLHHNNMTKDGKRIDFDMSLWPILYEFKNNGMINLAFRKPTSKSFDVTQYDIEHFPNLKNAVPFYWPTNGAPIFSESTTAVIKNIFSLSNNTYSSQVNSVYKKLETNPVFVHHKYATLLRYILSHAETYRYLSQLHIRKECTFQYKSVIEMLVQCQAARIQKFKDKIVNVPAFADFMKQHGENIFKKIVNESMLRNKKYERQISQIKSELKALHLKSESLSAVNADLLRKSTDSAPRKRSGSIEFLAPPIIVDDYTNNEKLLQQKKDERDLQLTLFETNESEMKSVAIKIGQKEMECQILFHLRIDTDYVVSAYHKICGHLGNTTTIQEEESVTSTPAVVANTNTYNFFGLFSKQEPVIKPSKPKDYISARDIVIESMQLYIKPSIFAFSGLLRKHGDLAKDIMEFCKALNPDAADIAANNDAIIKLKLKLQIEKSNLSTGEMFTVLNELLKNEVWNIKIEDAQQVPSLSA